MFSPRTLCSTSEKILARPLYYFSIVCVFAAVLHVTDYMLGVDNKINHSTYVLTNHLRIHLHFTTTVTSCCSRLPMVEGVNSNSYFPSSVLCTPTIFSHAWVFVTFALNRPWKLGITVVMPFCFLAISLIPPPVLRKNEASITVPSRV